MGLSAERQSPSPLNSVSMSDEVRHRFRPSLAVTWPHNFRWAGALLAHTSACFSGRVARFLTCRCRTALLMFGQSPDWASGACFRQIPHLKKAAQAQVLIWNQAYL